MARVIPVVQRDDSFFDQFGGSVGGPIWKNKIFAFFDYETVRSPASQTNIGNGWYDTSTFRCLCAFRKHCSEISGLPGFRRSQQGHQFFCDLPDRSA